MTGQTDTIAAIATPPGVGGIGVIRVSGPHAPIIARAVLGDVPKPRHAQYCEFRDQHGQLLDSGLALYFPGPASFTGEDVLELQGHGGPVIMNLLLKRVLAGGARIARPGEFSERAFLNGKLDLAQAEAIADLIESGTDMAARAASRSLEGVFSDRVNTLLSQLIDLRVFVEAAIDFPDEEVAFLADSDVLERLDQARDSLDKLLEDAHQGQLLRDGLMLAIIGRPNAGKSSLLNALSGEDAAIVTEIPGTTRDVLRTAISLDGMPVHLVDTAGIRDTKDLIEAEGVRRARDALRKADVILLVVDCCQELVGQLALQEELPDRVPVIVVFNKIDLKDEPARINRSATEVWLSAKTGEGLDGLHKAIRKVLGLNESSEGAFTARTRHLDALRRVIAHLQQGRAQLTDHQAGELLAEELRQAQQALGEITGTYASDDLLGAIFASFCIGK